MCFSKEVSFIASGVLALVGATSIGLVSKRRQWRFFPFACLPLIFSLQQFCEGLVWWSLERNFQAELHTFVLAYLFFALFFWPFWIPFSLYFIEERKHRLFIAFTIFGTLVGIGSLLYHFADRESLSAIVLNRSICYSSSCAPPHSVGFLLYFLAAIGPTFFSSRVTVKILGGTFTLFALVSYWINQYAFVSIWCFFSALISLFTLWITYQETELSI